MKTFSKVKIKKATISDIEPFWNLFKDSVKTQFPQYSFKVKKLFLKKYFTKKSFVGDLKRKKIDLLLAFINNQIVGYLLALPPYGGISYISWIAVKDSFRKKGIGSSLLKEYEIVAKRKGIHKIHLWTDRRNLRFYKKNGWTPVGHIPKNYFGADDWLFYKSIQNPKY